MPRFVVITNGLMGNMSFAVKDEEAARLAAEHYERWKRVKERMPVPESESTPRQNMALRRKLIAEQVAIEPLPEGFEIRKIYKQPRKSPRDFR